jgi:hypothetical protein
MIRAMTHPITVQPNRRLTQKTDKVVVRLRIAAIAHGIIYPALRIATITAMVLVKVDV